ncbi:hypothetical protein [Actinocorallia populi]|uniref:hypothetical protein n=1 Tax=Actinocorallia populi TaxID=2079200 RepID=UPI000D094E2D|nr:hypothetical protein [Actinocorallia populi]
MFAVSTRAALAAALAAGAALALPAAASAAPAKPCAVGKWKLAQYKMGQRDEGYTASAKGGEGIRLTVAKKSVRYDFNGSKRVVTKGSVAGDAYDLVSVYRGTLKAKSVLTGGRKGSLSLKARSATGDAKVSDTNMGVPLGSYSLVKNYRKAETDPLVPVYADFTCTAKTLKLTMEADGAGTIDVALVYRRV